MLLFFIHSAYVFEMSGYSESLCFLHSGNTMVNSNSSQVLPHIFNHGIPDHHLLTRHMPSDDFTVGSTKYTKNDIWSKKGQCKNVKEKDPCALWKCKRSTRSVRKAPVLLCNGCLWGWENRLCNVASATLLSITMPQLWKKQGHKLVITNTHTVKAWECCNSRRAKCNWTAAHVQLLVNSNHADKHYFPLSGIQEQIKHDINLELN